MKNEKRMIDASEFVKQLEEEFHGMISDSELKVYQIISRIEEQPTVDAVEVVRCKDCKHRVYVDMGDEIGEIGGCKLFEMAMPYDNFCSYGERKGNG